MNNRNLLFIFVALLAIYGLSQLFSSKKERTFKTDLIQIDSTEVTAVTINPKGEDTPEFTLNREENGWIASSENINTKATKSAVDALLANLSNIKTKRIAAKSPDKWAEYEVEEGNGTSLQVYSNGKIVEDFILGRFSFNQQTRSATSFIRLKGEDEVYAVDGLMTMTLSQGFDTYRNKTMLNLGQESEITTFSFQNDTINVNYTLQNGQWSTGELLLDSTKVTNFLNDLKSISGTDFADDFDEVQAGNLPATRFIAQGNNILKPINIICYRDTTREKPFVLQSSQNREAYFESDSTGVFSRIFKNVGDFISE